MPNQQHNPPNHDQVVNCVGSGDQNAPNPSADASNQELLALIDRAEQTHSLGEHQLAALLGSPPVHAALLAAANRVREKYVGDEVHLRGLIEFGNRCTQNCLYCGLRRDNRQVQRYQLDADTIVRFATNARWLGYRTVVLQSGEGPFYSLDEMVQIIRAIKSLDLAITLSIGEKSTEEYQAYREAGADRYLIRIETTDRALYQTVSPGMSFDNRLRCLRDLKALGYEVGTGCLIGLPGQSVESLARDILFFKEIDADMIGVGPFVPNPETPLGKEAGGDFALSVRVMALVRLLMPDVNIPATTAMETLNPQGRMIALGSGANVVMPNVTEGEYRRKYALYPGKICVADTPEHCKNCISGKIVGLGRRISSSSGFRKRIVR